MKATPTPARLLRRNADDKWRAIIQVRDRECQMPLLLLGSAGPCDLTAGLHAAHYIPRRVLATRWEPDNGMLLCALKHHPDFDQYRVPRYEVMLHKIGLERLERLQLMARDRWDGDYQRVLEELKSWTRAASAAGMGGSGMMGPK